MQSLKLRKLHLGITLLIILIISSAWAANLHLVLLSQDPYTDTANGFEHATEVEPMMAAVGPMIVTAFQVGRLAGTGAENLGWATSFDNGNTWRRGLLSGTTTITGGSWFAVSLPIVVFNQRFGLWLISMAAYDDQGNSIGFYYAKSHDGLNWSQPILAASTNSATKQWMACDNYLRSPHYGSCYVTWVDTNSFIDYFTASKDGGKTWSTPIASPDQATGEIGSMVVQPNGHVIMVGTYGGPNFDQGYAIQSIDGGKTLEPSVNFSTVEFNYPAQGYMRADPFPSSAVDASGLVYVVYPDCRFRPNCATNDLVLTTSSDGVNWSPLTRIPIDPVTSGADHFITGLGIDSSVISNLLPVAAAHSLPAKLGLSYYFFPNGNCDINSCELHAGYISSENGGKTWDPYIDVAGPMSLNWLAATDAGQMVGNNISTVFSLGQPFAAYALAQPPNPNTGNLNEATFSVRLPTHFSF